MVEFEGANSFWGVLFGLAANPYLLLFRKAETARLKALDLEGYRLFGGVLETERSQLFPVTLAANYYLWNRQPRVKGKRMNLIQYLERDHLTPKQYEDVNVPRESYFAEHALVGKYTFTVPHKLAHQLGGPTFTSDVELDCALLTIWGRYTNSERMHHLTVRERELYKLWKRLPKSVEMNLRPLNYHAEAPRYG